MKKLFVLWVLSLGCFTQISASDWFPIGAKWYWTDFHCMRPECAYSTLEIVGDTTVDGKILKKGIVHYFDGQHPDGRIKPEAEILFEEENGKVNYYFRGNSYRLYDFNLQAGDTMYTDMTLLSYNIGNVSGEKDTLMTAQSMVDSVDTVEIGGLPLRRLHLSPIFVRDSEMGNNPLIYHMTYTAVERIGFMNAVSFFGWVDDSPILTGGVYGSLRCYSDDEISYRKNENISCDSLSGHTHVAVQTNLYAHISIYPNPVIDYLTVDIEKENIRQIRIIALDGKVVDILSGSIPEKIEVDRLNKGVYLLYIETRDQNILMGKFIKQ